MNDIGRWMVIGGLAIAALGAVLWLGGGRIPLGRLPGDIIIHGEHGTIWIPITTCILLSLGLTLVLWLARWLGR